MKKIAILGSTGSIGAETVKVVQNNSDKFKIVSISAGNNSRVFFEQVNSIKPLVATTITAPSEKSALRKGTTFYFGSDAYLNAIIDEADIVVIALVGFIGVKAALVAIEKGKDIALANKESLVCAGELIMKKAAEAKVKIIPIDSEHSAIFQALNFNRQAEFKKLIITASGGAFRSLSVSELENMTAKDALNHPTWNMGKKITIDCATMMNKGFEVIEAKWLYNAKLEDIEVVIHPESVIHSLVEFKDNAVMAELSYPTMEIPIQLALSYPERLVSTAPRLDLLKVKNLTFLPLEKEKYPCFYLAIEAIKKGDNFPCAVNAANEIAVQSFLSGKIKFTDIAKTVRHALKHTERVTIEDYNELYLQDKKARLLAESFIGELNDK